MSQVCQASPNLPSRNRIMVIPTVRTCLPVAGIPRSSPLVLHRNRPAQAGEVAVGNYFLGCDMNAGESRVHSIKK